MKLLNNNGHADRKQSIVLEAQKLTGKLGHLAKGSTWIFHLLSHLHTSIAHALSENKCLLLESSREFREIVIFLKTGSFNAPCKDQAKYISFAMNNTGHAGWKQFIVLEAQKLTGKLGHLAEGSY